MVARDESNLDMEAIVGKLSSSENLQCSPVSFLIRSISELLEGKKTPDAFAQETIIATKRRNFISSTCRMSCRFRILMSLTGNLEWQMK